MFGIFSIRSTRKSSGLNDMVRLNCSANATSACDAGPASGGCEECLVFYMIFHPMRIGPDPSCQRYWPVLQLVPTHCVYKCVYVMYYIITMYYITILNWHRRSKPPGQSPKKGSQRHRNNHKLLHHFYKWAVAVYRQN